MKRAFYYSMAFLLVSCSSQEEKQITDVDGNTYDITQIGNQKWTTKNLIVKHYQNGDLIQEAANQNEWDSLTNVGIGAYCILSFYSPFEDEFGLLYNWHAVHDPRGLSPSGWHIPTDDEWVIMKDFLGGFSFAGKKMRFSDPTFGGWQCEDDSDNSSGFTAYPGGACNENGTFLPSYLGGYWWSSTETDPFNAVHWRLLCGDPAIYRTIGLKQMGMSIRCIKD